MKRYEVDCSIVLTCGTCVRLRKDLQLPKCRHCTVTLKFQNVLVWETCTTLIYLINSLCPSPALFMFPQSMPNQWSNNGQTMVKQWFTDYSSKLNDICPWSPEHSTRNRAVVTSSSCQASQLASNPRSEKICLESL